MSFHYTVRVYRCNDAAFFRQQVELATQGKPGSVIWGKEGTRDQDLRLHQSEICQTLYLPYQPGESVFIDQLGTQLNVPWLELRIQDRAIWDYALVNNNQCIDTFSVCPQYWDNSMEHSELEKWRGKPDLLEATWGIPVERVGKYLVNWGFKLKEDGEYEFELHGKAYPNDEHEYGDYTPPGPE